MTDAIKIFAEQFGLLQFYAVIIAFAGFSASGFKHLFFVLGILSGIYITMFKAFDLKAQFGPIEVSQLLPVSQDLGTMIAAVIFVYIIGFAAYGLKRLVVPQNA